MQNKRLSLFFYTVRKMVIGKAKECHARKERKKKLVNLLHAGTFLVCTGETTRSTAREASRTTRSAI